MDKNRIYAKLKDLHAGLNTIIRRAIAMSLAMSYIGQKITQSLVLLLFEPTLDFPDL